MKLPTVSLDNFTISIVSLSRHCPTRDLFFVMSCKGVPGRVTRNRQNGLIPTNIGYKVDPLLRNPTLLTLSQLPVPQRNLSVYSKISKIILNDTNEKLLVELVMEPLQNLDNSVTKICYLYQSHDVGLCNRRTGERNIEQAGSASRP